MIIRRKGKRSMKKVYGKLGTQTTGYPNDDSKAMPTMDDLADALKESGCEDLAGAVLRGKEQLQAKLKSRKA